jgi:CDP-L-myo-inositol myo-inositolphosphotransferase
MADHITDPELIRRVLSTPMSAQEIVLGIDRDRGHLFDSEDATKVRLDGDRISQIGKHVEPWDATDTGVFLCTGALVDGLQEAASRGRHGLSDGVAVLAQKGNVRTVDVTGLGWIDVDTPAAWDETRRRILSSLSAKPEDGFISRWINRPVSIRISAMLSSTSITPDQITFLSFAMTLAGAALLAMGQTGLTIAGGLVVQAASILDGSDGEIARLKHQTTRRGAWLDTVLDRYGDFAVVLAITLAESRVQFGAPVWLGGMVALSGFLLASYTTKEYALRHGYPYPNDLLNRIKRRDLRLFGICLGALIGHPYAALLILGGVSHACIVGILLRGWRGVAKK